MTLSEIGRSAKSLRTPAKNSWRVSIQKNSPSKSKKAVLVLSDGTFFVGQGFGKPTITSGETVFSTSMVGYPEALTDPSYRGQLLTLTYPLVGNYGVPRDDLELGLPLYFESDRIQPSALIIHELCTNPYHWACARTLEEWLVDEGIPGIYGIDTRHLTKKLRTHGVMLGLLQVCEEGREPDLDSLLAEVKHVPDPNLTDLVKGVSVKEPIVYKAEGNKTVVLVDCGVKNSIIRNLLKRGISVVRVPYSFSAKQIMEYKPDGVVVSNGPGDPKKCVAAIRATSELVERVPVMGICLGNQILALAMGGDTYKMKFGHRSQNQPALDLNSKRCYITTQNHGYAIDANCFEKTPLECWFVNANDRTVEGVRHRTKPVFGVQWHPEASPGPYDTEFLFDEFGRLLEAT